MNKKNLTHIEHACMMCDTMMRKFAAPDLPPKHKFHYHQGVFLSGMLSTYKVCGEEKYYEYIKAWVDSIIYPDGSIHDFDKKMLDDIQPGILLLYLYKRTGDERYAAALKTLMPILREWKRNEAGGFWHKEFLPDQMWLDGLYMAGPLQAEYAAVFDEHGFLETAIEQAYLMKQYMTDKNTGLLFHAWDQSKKEWWADSETGLSSEIWGRALGWYAVAVLDILKFTPQDHPQRQGLVDIEYELLKSVVNYQDDKTGMWFQVVDKINRSDNWVETSCTSLFVYAIARAVEAGILDKSYLSYAQRGYEGIIDNSLEYQNDDALLSGICIGTNVCNYTGYISRPTSTNDLHGVGAFLLMSSQMAAI